METHAEFFYLGFLLLATGYGLRASTSDSFLCLVILWFLFITAQIPELWNSPRNMASLHAGAFFIALGGLHNGISVRILVLTTLMTVCSGLWVIFSYIDFPENSLNFPGHLFWWQSIVNLLFLAMCITVIVGCYNSLRMTKQRRRVRRAGFLARSSENIPGGV